MRIVLLFAIIFIGLSAFYFAQTSPYLKGYKQIKAQIKNTQLDLYVADTEALREKGLSGVPSLKNDEGMIFIFPKASQYAFWMKDMKFSLDFIYLNGSKVVDLKEDISPLSYPSTFSPVADSDKIIEVKDGTIKRTGVMVGDSVKLVQ